MTADQILQLLNLAPVLAPPLAQALNELFHAAGYDVNKLVSAGRELNSQTLTHVEMEIIRAKERIEAKKADATKVAEAVLLVKSKVEPLKGGDPKSK